MLEQKHSTTTSDKRKDWVHNEFMLDYEQMNSQDLGSFLGTMRLREEDITFNLQKYKSSSSAYIIIYNFSIYNLD